jgi:UDP-N-acetylglucosamine/UDP-N-acetylgalactosamine diphosphorylase
VDNPIVRVVDPIFVGLHDLDGCEMSSKMLPKREPLEKLGNFCLVDGKMTVIEYSDLPNDLAHERLPGGQLRFLAGSIAIHMIQVAFVETLNRGDSFHLPYHRAEKKVAYFDPQAGKVVKPTAPNAVKMETFVFDALPRCAKSIVYETDRADEFAPIKNASGPGVLDSPQTSQQIQIERAARWLESAGSNVPRHSDGSCAATIEISQFTAIEPDDLRKVERPARIDAGAKVLL